LRKLIFTAEIGFLPLVCGLIRGRNCSENRKKQLTRRIFVKKTLSILSVVVGALAYLYMVVTTAKGTGEGVSLSTFGLWSALAWITGFTMLKQKANPAVPMIYGIGAGATTLVLLIKGRYGWSGFDTIIAALVVLCIVLWLTNGAKWALILSVAAAVIASLPFIIMTWKSPAGSPIIPNSGFLLANTLMLISAKAWTLEDRLYAGVNVIVCSLLVIPWLIQ
jgi:hypothetical protein